MADIFVSYTSSDRDWAFWIGQEVEALGHTPHIHEWEIPGGANIMAWMTARTDAAAHVLCVVSEKYLKAPYSSLERTAAEWAALKKRPNFALPVFVEPCEPPVLFAPLKRCDLYGISEDEARARLAAFLAPAAKPAGPIPFPGGAPAAKSESLRPVAVAFPGTQLALSNIPIRIPLHFLGRDDALAEIGEALKRHAVTVVHGLRGVGKSTIAAAYAEKRRGDYRATWWIRAQTESTMRADLVALGVRLNWVGAEAKEEKALAAVSEHLRSAGDGLLLIYDNAVDAASLKPYLPMGGGAKALVTSNAHAWRGVAEPVELPLWPKEIGADYFIARTGREAERAAAEALSGALGGLPLAHEQAAAYCERTGVHLAEYKKRFEATPGRLLDAPKDAPSEYHGGLTVAKTFALAIDEAAKLFSAAEPLIVHAALLAPEPIPLFLFSEAREKFGEPLASALADDGLDEAVAALRTFALVDRDAISDERDPSITTDCIRLHRLVRQVAAARAEGEAREAMLRSLVDAIASVFPGEASYDPKSEPRARRLHAFVLATGREGKKLPRASLERILELMRLSLSRKREEDALFSEARTALQLMIEQVSAILEIANAAEDFAGAWPDFAGAWPLIERTLASLEKAYGPGHPQTKNIATAAAEVLDVLGRVDEAAALRARFGLPREPKPSA